MFKATADKKGIVELSLKQRDQWLTYQFDKAQAEWPTLLPRTPPPSPRAMHSPRPKPNRTQSQ